MIEHAVYAVAGAVVSVLAYLYGYSRGYSDGSYETADGKTNLGKAAFESNVWWGAKMARSHPECEADNIADVVRKRHDQLTRLSLEELTTLETGLAILRKEKEPCHGN